jgi:hypothetical protein
MDQHHPFRHSNWHQNNKKSGTAISDIAWYREASSQTAPNDTPVINPIAVLANPTNNGFELDCPYAFFSATAAIVYPTNFTALNAAKPSGPGPAGM